MRAVKPHQKVSGADKFEVRLPKNRLKQRKHGAEATPAAPHTPELMATAVLLELPTYMPVHT